MACVGGNECEKVKFVEEMNNPGLFIVKRLNAEVSHNNPFYTCITHSSEFTEVKFDFTDRDKCLLCEPVLLQPDLSNLDELTKEVILTSRDDKKIWN